MLNSEATFWDWKQQFQIINTKSTLETFSWDRKLSWISIHCFQCTLFVSNLKIMFSIQEFSFQSIFQCMFSIYISPFTMYWASITALLLSGIWNSARSTGAKRHHPGIHSQSHEQNRNQMTVVWNIFNYALSNQSTYEYNTCTM